MRKTIFFASVLVLTGLVKGRAQMSEQKVMYLYNNMGYRSEEKTTASNGDILITRYRYISDLAIPQSCISNTGLTNSVKGYINLLNLNRLSLPVETYSIVKKPNGTETVVKAELITYLYDKPYAQSVYALETAVPVQNFVPCSVNSCALVMSSYYKEQTQLSGYDNHGNPGLSTDRYGRQKKASFYDATHSRVLMTLANAGLDYAAYTSFEPGDVCHWNVPSPSRVTSSKFTGTSSYNLGNGNVSFSVVMPTGTYIISMWKQVNANVYVLNNSNTFSPVFTGPVVNRGSNGQWQYVEYKITIPSSAGLRISGDALIDELRMYPFNAKMTTATYGPHGPIDQTDMKNNVLRYEYDNQGRVLTQRDFEDNIIKRLENKIQRPD